MVNKIIIPTYQSNICELNNKSLITPSDYNDFVIYTDFTVSNSNNTFFQKYYSYDYNYYNFESNYTVIYTKIYSYYKNVINNKIL
jgi:hypothetical protein